MKNNKKGDKNRNLYDFDLENKVKKRGKDRKEKNNKVHNKKEKTQSKKQETKKASSHIDPDNEIIIGVTRYPEEKKLEKNSSKKIKEKNSNIKAKNLKTKEKNNKIKKETKEAEEIRDVRKAKKVKETETKDTQKKKGNIAKILKWTGLFVIIIGICTFAMLSPIFNIGSITVTGNSIVSAEEIISLSGITIGENIFRINKKEIKTNIKKNGYIEELSIRRSLPCKIEITVEERQPSFIIEYGSGYVYINNQGYILEISNVKKQLPIILGIKTPSEQLVEANRLNEEDLKKLGTVLKIISVAQVNDIASLITTIDITDSNDYKLYFESEQKEAYLGDCSDLETRMLYLTAILKSESGKPGEIFVNMNLNIDDAFFRESV